MNESALYNEMDEFAADWLENLIRADLIAPGRVDRRSIVDLTPDDLLRHRQVHLFAGIGIWSASMRDAGIRDDERWWSASCPCQPFSAAGQGNGFADERHLWPYAYHLITQCRPPKVVGEQVASPDGLNWLDLVSTDMEAARYAFGASDLCAAGVTVPAGETQIGQATVEWIRGAILTCPDPFLAAELRDYAEWLVGQVGVGAPHIRQRLYWVADAAHELDNGTGVARSSRRLELADGSTVSALADADGWHEGAERQQRSGQHGQQPQDGSVGLLGHASRSGLEIGSVANDRRGALRHEGPTAPTSSLSGFWSDAGWIICTDGQARPVEVGTFPLAHGERSRVGKLRAYGNQIVRPLATRFILAATEALSQTQAVRMMSDSSVKVTTARFVWAVYRDGFFYLARGTWSLAHSEREKLELNRTSKHKWTIKKMILAPVTDSGRALLQPKGGK